MSDCRHRKECMFYAEEAECRSCGLITDKDHIVEYILPLGEIIDICFNCSNRGKGEKLGGERG